MVISERKQVLFKIYEINKNVYKHRRNRYRHMEHLDYQKIGLKCGIEIHQRLDTHKLFCSCPSTMIEDESKVEAKKIVRQLRAVAGETGTVDVAARHEMEKGTYFVYHYYPATNCLVELDEEPPHPMNPEALRTVLQVSKMMEAHIVDEVQVMRKTVVNGSNTTGFQRTALVAVNGQLNVSGARIGVPTISIEEEAAKDITKGIDADGRQFVEYGLDRLGIPLIEIGTDPDIKTPEQCMQVAEHIGMILRSTGKVARGLGTIRQDVNVSVKDGARIEIKGAQDLKMLPTLVENEAKRQLALFEIKKELEKRKLAFDKIKSKDVTVAFKNTECKFVRTAIEKGAIALAFTMPGLNGLLGKETQPGKRLGTELSDYAKAKTGIGGIIHSDEDLTKYNFKVPEVDKMIEESQRQEYAFVIIVAEKNTAEAAMKHVVERAKMCLNGVPREVRRANPDGTTTYMRPMPGAARMYPETDIPPIRPDVKGIILPELLTEKKERFKEIGLAEDLARDISKSGKNAVFEGFVDKFTNVKPAFIAETMISTPKNLKRKYDVETAAIKDTDFENIFSMLNAGKIPKDAVEEILVKICKGEKVDYTKYAPMKESELEAELKKIVKESKELEFNALVGKAMGTLKGKADGKKIIEMLKKLV
jgi:glutamyl-tRNA(Gln) amidotransferase subunit E